MPSSAKDAPAGAAASVTARGSQGEAGAGADGKGKQVSPSAQAASGSANKSVASGDKAAPKAPAAREGKEKGAADAREPKTTAPHTEVPNQPGDFISRWNGARLKCIRNPNPSLDTVQTHVMSLPELCLASQNPLPGSSLTIRYRGKQSFLEVFSLSAYVQASIGHPMVRDVEALTQAVAIDCAEALGQKVEVDGLFILRGLAQTVMTEVVAKPRRDDRAARMHKADRPGKAHKADKGGKGEKSGRMDKARKEAGKEKDKDREKSRKKDRR